MNANAPLHPLPQGFRDEQRDLKQAGITNWCELRELTDQNLSRLVATGRSTARNLKRLRGIAVLVCDLELEPADAALLMHAGFATVAAIATSSPQEITNRTGRLERQLGSGRAPVVDLAIAKRWMLQAKARQTMN
ncbi:protein of unknown function DUF4332-containing protein [Synechococcus sp. SYN20]|jgi:hypothetical protein|uniref:DUF4332 domain-containing protein n=1 Tax=Synechococcus sp. SYN20 TaxID=1050714 RepID=UPI0016453AEC|nr:DUF4332 domain-containing protein [Synechococcus sp. SYN20]QNJ26636.1 protein of unknown function DUF4332-containing protein [Synechococcus sp. SYN20]